MIGPKVSIIIPVYNGSDFMKQAIDSALSQTYLNKEVIVVNDGSNDDGATESIALSYGDDIRYYFKPNGGVASALNLGIRNMTGTYFSWLSHDDIYLPTKVEHQIEAVLGEENDETILYGGYELINGKSQTLDTVDFLRYYTLDQLNTSLFPVFRGLANGCTMLIHRAHFDRVGVFREDLSTTQDYDLWFRMFRDAQIKFLPGTFLKSRIHGGQTSRTASQHQEECEVLWIGMLNAVSEKEMCSMEGSPFAFYKCTAKYLRRHSDYFKAERHAGMLAELYENKYVKVSLSQKFGSTVPRGGLIRLLRRIGMLAKTDGIGHTVRRVFRKLT